MLFTNGGGEESSYLQTSRQNTAGTLAWKSDSTSENSAAARTEKHSFAIFSSRTKAESMKSVRESSPVLQLFFRISRT